MSYSKNSDSKFKPILLYNDPKEIVPFSSIVVPSSMRSSLWKYFGFPADKNQEIITKNRIVCCICHSYIAYNKNTTNLSTHLNCKHPDVLAQLKWDKRKPVECEESKSPTQIKGGAIQSSSKRFKMTEHSAQVSWCTDNDENRVKEEIHPTGITEKICAQKNEPTVTYKRKLNHNNSQVVILNASSDKSIYENLVIESDEDEIDDPDNVSQYIETIDYNNIEIGEDGNDIIAEVLEVDVSGTPQSKVELVTEEFATVDESTGVLYDNPVKEEEIPSQSPQKTANISFDTSNKVDADSTEIIQEITKFVIKDIISPNIVNGSGFKELIGFFTHADLPTSIQIEKCIEKEYSAEHSSVMSAIKSIINNRNYSLSFHKLGNSSIVEISINYWPDVNNPNMPLENLIFCIAKNCTNFILSNIDNLTRCSAFVVDFELGDDFEAIIPEGIPVISTFSFVAKMAFDACMQLSAVRSAIELADASLMGKIEKSHTWLQQFECLSQFISESTNAENNQVIQVLIKCFQPLKNCLEVLAFETSYASIMKPVTSQLISLHYTDNGNVVESVDSDIAVLEKDLKETIHQIFQQKIMNNSFLTIASFFDPRFQRMIESDDLKLIRDELEKVVRSCELKTAGIKPEEKITKIKHEKSLPLLSLFSNISPAAKMTAPKNRFDIDFRRYNEEACLEIQLCPLEWWFETESSYPALKPLVRKYFCVPAFVSNFHRLPLNEQEELESKYDHIENNANDKLLWLHLNKLRQGLSRVES